MSCDRSSAVVPLRALRKIRQQPPTDHPPADGLKSVLLQFVEQRDPLQSAHGAISSAVL